ncbi:MAG: hypothetical protein AAFQ32_00715 [Pseudomonadota bacterium]
MRKTTKTPGEKIVKDIKRPTTPALSCLLQRVQDGAGDGLTSRKWIHHPSDK